MAGDDIAAKAASPEEAIPVDEKHALEQDLQNTGKSRWERSWPIIACGAGLFSDGYLNNVKAPTLTFVFPS